jgi:hypothetical protein
VGGGGGIRRCRLRPRRSGRSRDRRRPLPLLPPAGSPPARHAEDDWLDQNHGKPPVLSVHHYGGLVRPGDFLRAQFLSPTPAAKGLTNADVGQVICARHQSTSFRFSDATWAKYGGALSERAGDFVDPKSKQVPTTGLFQAIGMEAS